MSPTFSERLVADLPEPVRRYFRHAIAEGTPLATSVALSMHGRIKVPGLGRWLQFEAEEELEPERGFIWRARVGGMLRARDELREGRGRVEARLLGVPVMRASGADVDRSAAGRLAAESIWQPAGLLPERGVSWEADGDEVRAARTVAGERTELRLRLADEGRVLEASVERWNRDRYEPFGARVEDEGTFAGYTIPTRVHAGWGYGTPSFGEFFDATITSTSFA